MSKVEIEIPDDRWFRGERDFRPKDKQLCVVIHKYGGQTPWKIGRASCRERV